MMNRKSSILLFVFTLLLLQVNAQESSKKELPAATKYTIENCINRFNPEKTEKTAVGYQYWFIDQNFLEDGETVKLSVVGPNQATHPPHKHAGDEIFYILEGNAQFYLNGQTTTGGHNTTFYCPEFSDHGISNVSNQTLKYLVIRKYPKTAK